jgi:hypothetical protein
VKRQQSILGDLVGYAATFNEPDIPQLLSWINVPGTAAGTTLTESFQTNLGKIRQEVNARIFLAKSSKSSAPVGRLLSSNQSSVVPTR